MVTGLTRTEDRDFLLLKRFRWKSCLAQGAIAVAFLTEC